MLLLGESGAGKSTLLKALAGVLGDDEGDSEGSLSVDGMRPRPGSSGLVLQDPDGQIILPRIGDDVAFGLENLGVARGEIWQRVGDALDAVGLALPLSRPTSALSGGQKQRLALAGVLAMRPGLILLDEPTANLDPEGVEEVRDAVVSVANATGATIIVVEHRVAVWQTYIDRVIVLAAGGGVLADGSVSAVLAARGAELAASGIWVPGHPPAIPTRVSQMRQVTVLGAHDVSIGRGGVSAQRSLDVEVARNSTLAITGANGSGKSTLGLTMAGLLAPMSGHVVASPELAKGAGKSPIDWRSKQLLTRIGMVFQQPEHQFVASTVRGELEIGPRALELPTAEIRDRSDRLLERLRLTGLAAANPFTLSGGEKRRLSVATMLSTRPEVLILDEPTFGQDSRTWSELVGLLAELVRDGTALVTITHDAELVAALADQELVLEC